MNLFLIGYRCTGKTTVGEALARRLGWNFVDTDRMIVDRAGVSIAHMVQMHGWPFFREQEHEVVKTVSTGDRQVVASGGGIVLDDRNIALMRQSGRIVWLTASEPTIATRMQKDEQTTGSRPTLTGLGRIAEIKAVMAERTPLYEKAADLAVDTNRTTIAAICDRIVAECAIED